MTKERKNEIECAHFPIPPKEKTRRKIKKETKEKTKEQKQMNEEGGMDEGVDEGSRYTLAGNKTRGAAAVKAVRLGPERATGIRATSKYPISFIAVPVAVRESRPNRFVLWRWRWRWGGTTKAHATYTLASTAPPYSAAAPPKISPYT